MSHVNDHEPAHPVPPLVCSGAVRQRDPSMFHGTEDHDAEDWLASYERVSTYNRWDDNMKLSSVGFYFKGLAETWFRNHGAGIDTWAEFKSRFTNVFGRPALRKLRAEQCLRERAQRTGETFTSYIEDILDLCNRANTEMSEEEKIRHILKGIDDDAFQMLLSKNPQTVGDVITSCQKFDELRRERAVTRRTAPQDQFLSSVASEDSNAALFLRLQQFVREEVARQLSLVRNLAEPQSDLSPSLRTVIQQQVADALPGTRQSSPAVAPVTNADTMAQMPTTAPLTFAEQVPPMPFAETYASVVARPVAVTTPLPYAATLASPGQRGFPLHQRVRPPRASPHTASQFSHPWRTQDNRPICFSCGLAGHVARYCRRGVMGARNSSWTFPYAPPESMPPADAYARNTPSHNRDLDSRRSSSPRRRSLSPMRRRPPTTEPEN